jgi:menaquinone-dependent protoporphyrinogen IX oxidase
MEAVDSLNVLVADASKYGATKGIAEFVGEKLRQRGARPGVKGLKSKQNRIRGELP